MKRLVAALLTAGLLTLAGPAPAALASQGCAQGLGGGCINLDNDGNGDLWVHTVQPGVWGLGKTKCGKFHIRLTRKSNGIPTVIRTSSYDRVYIPHGGAVMGPKWTLDKAYADGDVFCGNFDGWAADRWGCVTVHA